MTIAEELATRNFSIYGQWTGVLCIFLCFALGISHLFHVSIMILFGALCLASSFLIIFVEIPLLMRICPTSSKFDSFMRRFTTNYMRAAIYLVMGMAQWLSLIGEPSSLLAAAIMLTLAAIFYALAGVKGQGFVGSKTLGGQGVAQMII
ncbi:Golgi apparatus membrane protein tvp18 [Erysiphe neolycopersici]|uniref:Golgi apparatus membrane protein tvp18 n=1 Tax=Erysiphe neolycopersici TaxID=212602 RepID=A0A420HXM8_9PEZI|nr:Golgi apparatus membrane protein tvp18 [Erysiphe neolycopersici]